MNSLKLFLIVAFLFASGCRRGDNNSAPYVPISGSTIAPQIGQTIRYAPVGACSNPIWTTEKPSILKVVPIGNDANVTALSRGEAILHVECDSGLTGRIMVYVQ